ncbi:MAG: hypothetical protein IH936_11345, partial [Acidobacteria bacterium]|nr:hypothetical protein [Acidobacteriota bacterium]
MWDRNVAGNGRLLMLASSLGVAVFVATAAVAIAGERVDRKRLEETLERLLMNKQGATKIAMARFQPYEFLDQEVLRAVCTDIAPNGAVSFVKPWSVLGPKEVIPRASLREVASPGAGMQVSKIEVQSDRIALTLRDISTGQYSRARLWFFKGFASQVDPETAFVRIGSVMEFQGALGRAISQAVASGQPAARLLELRRAYEQPGVDGADKLSRGIRYVKALDAEISRRRAWSELLGRTEDLSELSRARATVAGELATLSERLHGPRLVEIRAELARHEAEIADLRQGLEEVGTSESALDGWEAHTEVWRSLVDEYSGLGGSGAANRADLERSVGELAAVRRTFVLEREEDAATATRLAREALGDAFAETIDELRSQES